MHHKTTAKTILAVNRIRILNKLTKNILNSRIKFLKIKSPAFICRVFFVYISDNFKTKNMYIIDTKDIEQTKTFKALQQQDQFIKLQFLNSRKVREQITNGFLIYKNTGAIPPHIDGNNLKIIHDLIGMNFEP